MESRSKHSVSNIIGGAINRVVGILFPFILRTIIIKVLGEEYLGINSLFASVLQVLNFAELGLGSAIAANMYKPIAENDDKTLSALLYFYRKWYRIIGYMIIGFGLLILPFIKNFINGNIPNDINVYILFILYLSQTSFSYLFWAYKSTLITAHQRMDVVEKVGALCKFITFILQVVAILVFKDITLYVSTNLLCIVLNNIICKYIAERDYPECKCEGILDISIKNVIKKNIIALAFQKIGLTVSNSLGTIIISSFLGLSTVAIFGNYYYISSAAGAFVLLIYSSITASVGNSLVIDSTKKNYNDFLRLSFLNSWMVGWCSICMLCLYQPFMQIWMGNSLMLPMVDVICFVVCFYVQNIRKVVITYKDAAGMWYADKYKPLVGCIVNLVFNLLLIKYIGITGILLATIISNLLVEFPWETHVLFKIYFKENQLHYYKTLLVTTLSVLFAGLVTYYICELIQISWISLIVKLVVCITVPNVILYLLYRNRREYVESRIFIIKAKNIILKNETK